MQWLRNIEFTLPLRGVAAVPRDPIRPGSELETCIRRHEEQAFERGIAEGEQRLGELVLRQRTEVQQLYTGVLDSLRQAVGGLLHDTETTLIELAFEVAQKTVAELPLNVETVAANVRTALAAAKDALEVAVHLHPEDLELLRRLAPEALAPSGAPGTVRWVAAADIGRGGCLVRSELGAVDARRETRLERLRQATEP